MLTLMIILGGAWLGIRGPAWVDWRARRQLERDYEAKVVAKYLPSASCRGLLSS